MSQFWKGFFWGWAALALAILAGVIIGWQYAGWWLVNCFGPGQYAGCP